MALLLQKIWKNSSCIANHCGFLIALQKKTQGSPLTRLLFSFLYISTSNVQSATQSALHHSVSVQEPAAPKLSPCAWVMLSKAGVLAKLFSCFIPYYVQLQSSFGNTLFQAALQSEEVLSKNYRNAILPLYKVTQKCLFFGESWETHLLLKPVTQPGAIKSFKGPRAAPSLWADQISLLALFPHRCRWNMTWVATLEKTTESWISLAMTCLLS